MNTPFDFTGETKKYLSTISQVSADIDPALKRIEKEGGAIELDLYRADKIEKVVFSTIKINASGTVEATAMVWPDDHHCFPALWLNLTVVPSVMTVSIFDFVPMLDFVAWPEYGEKYVAPLEGLRKGALEIFGETVRDKAFDLSSRSIYILSPYKLAAVLSEEATASVPAVLDAYIKKYLGLWKEAKPLKEGPEKDFYLKKKNAARRLMKANDPGYHFMVNVFGEELTRGVFDAIF